MLTLLRQLTALVLGNNFHQQVELASLVLCYKYSLLRSHTQKKSILKLFWFQFLRIPTYLALLAKEFKFHNVTLLNQPLRKGPQARD